MFRSFLNNKSGASVVEYGIIVALVAASIIGGAAALGNDLSKPLNTANEAVVE